jgi:hypothetical protein
MTGSHYRRRATAYLVSETFDPMLLPLPAATTSRPDSNVSVPIPSAPIPQTYLPAGSLPLAAGASSSAAGVMTNEQLTAAVLDLGRMMAGVHAFLLGPQPGVAPPHPQPQLPPAPNPRQQLPSPASDAVYPYGMPQDSTAHTTAPAPVVSLGGVPIQEIQFPHSPSPLPPWLTDVAQLGMATGRIRIGYWKYPPAVISTVIDNIRPRLYPRVEIHIHIHAHQVSDIHWISIGYDKTIFLAIE